MDREFTITYKIEGVRVIKVLLPEGKEFPKNWDDMPPEIQDEWLYENQQSSELSYEDIHHSEAQCVLPVRHLRIVS